LRFRFTVVVIKSRRLPGDSELPEHLRSEISFLHTRNIPNLISYILYIA